MTDDPFSDGAYALFLLHVEGQNFASVIDDTHDLSTIAGGSRLLENVIKAVDNALPSVKGVLNAATIRSAGSTGLFVFRARQSDIGKILAELRRKVSEGPFCHLTVAVEAMEIEETAEAGNGEIDLKRISTQELDRLQARIRFAQMRASNIAIPQIRTDANTACDIDGFRPATRSKPENLAFSDSVQARREKGKKFRRDFGEATAVRTFDEMTTYKPKDRGPGQHRWNGRLAVVSIDGNRFGAIKNALCKNAEDIQWFGSELEKAETDLYKTMEAWKDKSEDRRYMFQYTPSSVPAGAKEEEKRRVQRECQIHGKQPETRLRFQSLISAGDDATYLMPAWLTWEFLEMFFTTHANKEIKRNDNKATLTYRAGVVICHDKAPIHAVCELADELSELARSDASGIDNPIAYEILKSFDLIGPRLNEYRAQKASGLNPSDVILDGSKLHATHQRLEQLHEVCTSADIKNPSRWPNFKNKYQQQVKAIEAGDPFHLSQWRDYIFED